MNWTTLLSFSVRGFQVPLLESSSIIVSIEAAKNLEIELFTPQRQEWFLSMLTLLPSSQMMFWSGQEDQLFNIMSDFWWEKLIAQYCNCYGVFLTCWMTVCCHKKFYCYCHCSPNSRNTLKKTCLCFQQVQWNQNYPNIWYSFEVVTLNSWGSSSKDAASSQIFFEIEFYYRNHTLTLQLYSSLLKCSCSLTLYS